MGHRSGQGGADSAGATRPDPLDKTSEVGWFDPASIPANSLPWLALVLKTQLLHGQFFVGQVD